MIAPALRVAFVPVVCATALAAAGCGGGSPAAEPTPATMSATTTSKCSGSSSAEVRAEKLRRLQRDLARVRRLSAQLTERTLDGTPALSRAVDVFLVHVADRDVEVHARSRLIDRAAAAVSPVCEQCFQALEASRPIAGGAKMACG